MGKCLLCSGLKQQNTAVTHPAYVQVRFQLVLLISSVSLLLSKYKFSNVHIDLVLLYFFVSVRLIGFFVCLFDFLCLCCLSHLASIRDIAASFLLWKSKLFEPHPYLLLLSGLQNSQATQLTCNASMPSSGFFLAKHSQPPPVSEGGMTQIWRIGKPEAEFPADACSALLDHLSRGHFHHLLPSLEMPWSSLASPFKSNYVSLVHQAMACVCFLVHAHGPLEADINWDKC